MLRIMEKQRWIWFLEDWFSQQLRDKGIATGESLVKIDGNGPFRLVDWFIDKESGRLVGRFSPPDKYGKKHQWLKSFTRIEKHVQNPES